MRVLTKSEAESWLPRASVKRDKNGDLGFPHGKNLTIRMPLPEKTYRIASLANFLLTGFHGSPFNGGLMWLTDWGMWSEVCEQAAYKMFELMRQPYDESRPLIEAPAHLFTREEKVAAQSFLILPILFGWDDYFIPESGRHFAFTSNDEFIDVVSNDDETHANMLSVLKETWGGKDIS